MIAIQNNNYNLVPQRQFQNSLSKSNNLQQESPQKSNEDSTQAHSSDDSQNTAFNFREIVANIIGFTPDKEGFLPSEFNTQLGIPSGINIHSTMIIRYDLSRVIGYYNNLDIKGSIQNAYQSFTKLSSQELESLINQAKTPKDESLYNSLLNIPQYLNARGELNESGKFRIFMALDTSYAVGDSTIALELQKAGNTYAKFIEENDNWLGMNILDKGKAGQLLRTSAKDMSPEEFGKQWAELRKEYQAKYDEWQEQLRKENEEIEEYNKNLREQKSKNKFKPIQVTSKSETYQDTSFLNTLDFIKSQQKLEQILILFGERSKGNLDTQSLKNYFATSQKRLDTEA